MDTLIASLPTTCANSAPIDTLMLCKPISSSSISDSSAQPQTRDDEVLVDEVAYRTPTTPPTKRAGGPRYHLPKNMRKRHPSQAFIDQMKALDISLHKSHHMMTNRMPGFPTRKFKTILLKCYDGSIPLPVPDIDGEEEQAEAAPIQEPIPQAAAAPMQEPIPRNPAPTLAAELESIQRALPVPTLAASPQAPPIPQKNKNKNT